MASGSQEGHLRVCKQATVTNPDLQAGISIKRSSFDPHVLEYQKETIYVRTLL